jgi:hypothetical protein
LRKKPLERMQRELSEEERAGRRTDGENVEREELLLSVERGCNCIY